MAAHLQNAIEYSIDNNTEWDFLTGMFYCMQLYTTIGYGNIVPETDLGKCVPLTWP